MKTYLEPIIQLNKKAQLVIIGGISLCLLVFFIAIAVSSPKTQSKKETPMVTPTPPPKVFIDAVKKQISLPPGEEPMIATVTDKSKLQTQEFFKIAENGDKVLMYKHARKAFLYRPSTDRVIAEAPFEYDDPNASASAAGNGKVLYESEN
jgi:hypothetical protein